MGRNYLGHLQTEDPLYGYLKYDIQPQLTGFCDAPVYRVYRLNGSNAVYLYEEKIPAQKSSANTFIPNAKKTGRPPPVIWKKNMTVWKRCAVSGLTGRRFMLPGRWEKILI